MKEVKWIRKILSLFILISALIYYFYGKQIILVGLFGILFLFLFFDLLDYFSKGKNKISKIFFKLYPKKKHEYKRPLTDATIFIISNILLILLFEKNIVVLSLILLTFIDASEQIIGINFPSRKLFWNKDKAGVGTIAGFIVSMIIGYLVITYLKFSIQLWIIIPISIIGALMGTLKRFDNIAIPWSIAIIICLLN